MGYFDNIKKKEISVEETQEKQKIREDNLRKDIAQVLEKNFDIDEFRDNINWFACCIMKQMDQRQPHITPFNHRKILLKENPFGGNTDVLFDFDPNLHDDFSQDIKLSYPPIPGVCTAGKFTMYMEKHFISVEVQQTKPEVKVIIPWTMKLCRDMEDDPRKLSEYIERESRKLSNETHSPISIKNFLTELLHTAPYDNDETSNADFVTVQKEIIKLVEKTMSYQPALEHLGIRIPVKCEMQIELTLVTREALNDLIRWFCPDKFTGLLKSQLMTIQ